MQTDRTGDSRRNANNGVTTEREREKERDSRWERLQSSEKENKQHELTDRDDDRGRRMSEGEASAPIANGAHWRLLTNQLQLLFTDACGQPANGRT